jgi:hypothetical protein
MSEPVKIVREFSACGPCLTFGRILHSETAKFYCWIDGSGKTGKISKARAHIEPCSCCRDHPKTSYPNGYMD